LLLLDNAISEKEVRKINDTHFQSNVDRLLDVENDNERVSVDITPDLVVQDPVDFAVALHTNPDFVSVTLTEDHTRNKYGTEWLNSACDLELVEECEEKLYEILDDNGLLFKFLVWPAGVQFESEIRDTLSTYGKIYSTQKIPIRGDKLDNFIFDVYYIEDEFKERSQNQSKIQAKINYVSKFDNDVVLYSVKLDEPKIKEGDSNTTAYIKEDIRSQCHPALPVGKAHLNPIIHSTDNFLHNMLVGDVVSEYV